MAITDPYSIMANALEQILTNEFGSDSPAPIIQHDRIHESLGFDRRDYIGISPEREPAIGLETRIEALIQYYGGYSTEVDPLQIVDPRIITNKAERLRRAIQAAQVVANDQLWYLDVVAVDYPNDATGNKSRFEMRVLGRGNNSAIVETTG